MDVFELIAPKEQVVCKACNYVMAKGALKDKCPACGVSAKMFIPYEEKVSRNRKIILALDLHPILVHFPQAFSISVLALGALCLVATGGLGETLQATLKTLSVLLPFALLAAALAGLFDGKIRFRKITTPLLLKKIYLSVAFLAFALANMLVILLMPMAAPTLLLSIVLTAGGIGCGTALSLMGVHLLNAKFAG
jgi:phage FluMu protein Com